MRIKFENWFRSVVPVEDRWCKECLDWVERAPWNRKDGDEGADGALHDV